MKRKLFLRRHRACSNKKTGDIPPVYQYKFVGIIYNAVYLSLRRSLIRSRKQSTSLKSLFTEAKRTYATSSSFLSCSSTISLISLVDIWLSILLAQ